MSGFHFPFYGGGGSVALPPIYGGAPTTNRPIPFTVSLYGTDYAIELAQYRRRSLAALERGGVVESKQPDDSQFNNDGAWWRYTYSWELGAGQQVQDFGEDSLPRRFWNSRGVDPWNEYQVCLQPATELAEAASTANVFLIATGGFVYMSDGTTVKRSADLTTWAAITGLTGTIRGFTTDGSDVYIATSTHIYTVSDNGGLAAAALTVDTDDYQLVAFVSNRLLAASDNVLYEIAGAGTRTALETHFQSVFRWTAAFAIGSRIYFGGYAGNRTELYAATTDSSGNLVKGAEAAPFAYNELLRGAVSYAGIVVIATSLGVRMATLSGDGSLTYGPLIDAPGDVQALTAEGRFVWFGWESFFGEGSGLGRLALDETPFPLQPAYATDVYTDLQIDDVTGVARFNGTTLFAVANHGVYKTNTSYVTSGWVESGEVYLGTVEPKAITSLEINHQNLAANETISVVAVNEQGDELGTGTDASLGSRRLAFGLDGSFADWVRIRVTMTGDGSSSPCALRWKLRGFPVVPLVEEWIVPLILHKHVVVNDGNGQLRSYNQLEQMERLVEACRRKLIVPYREGRRTYPVRIDKYEMQPHEWDDTSDFFDNLFVVRLVSVT